ncbi:hypothetical protein AVEN_102094-2-1, partial [Araneus ventricosus]
KRGAVWKILKNRLSGFSANGFLGYGGLVTETRLRDRRIMGSRPDNTEDPNFKISRRETNLFTFQGSKSVERGVPTQEGIFFI